MTQSNDIYSRTPTFHNTEAAYILPNDEAEHSRLVDQHHALVALTKNRVVHAPVSAPATILDIGCGTGIVTRYLSSHFPTAQHVYGIDLCPVPPQTGDDQVSNLSFVQGEFHKLVGADHRLQSGSADYVFHRLLVCGMTDWAEYMRDVLTVLKPGCWAEMGDWVEDVFYSDGKRIPHDEWDWLRLLRAGGTRVGLDMDAGLNIPRYMKEAGFMDIQRWEYRVPLWKGAEEEHPETRQITDLWIGDKMGIWWHMLPKLLGEKDTSDENLQRLRRNMRKDMEEEHGKYLVFCITIGRKPDS